MNAHADALAFANGSVHRQQQDKQDLADDESKGKRTRDLAISELNTLQDHALEKARAAEAAVSEVEGQLEEQQAELDRLMLRTQGKSRVADALDGVSCEGEVAIANAGEEVIAVAGAAKRPKEVAAAFKDRLERARAECASFVEATNVANAEHLTSNASADTSADREPGVAAQAADPKTGLAGGGRKKKKKRRKKRHDAAQAYLCAHRWCNRLCRNWAAGHVLCNLCDKYRLYALDDIEEWREES